MAPAPVSAGPLDNLEVTVDLPNGGRFQYVLSSVDDYLAPTIAEEAELVLHEHTVAAYWLPTARGPWPFFSPVALADRCDKPPGQDHRHCIEYVGERTEPYKRAGTYDPTQLDVLMKGNGCVKITAPGGSPTTTHTIEDIALPAHVLSPGGSC